MNSVEHLAMWLWEPTANGHASLSRDTWGQRVLEDVSKGVNHFEWRRV